MSATQFSFRLRWRHPAQRSSSSRGASSSSSAPAAVVFDLGKVLLDFDYTRSARRLSEACRSPTPAKQEVLLELFGHAPQPTGLLEAWGGRSLVEQLERGQLSDTAFFEAVSTASGLQLEFPEFASLYGDIFTPLQPMLAQQQHLHSAGVPTYLLSNCSSLHIADVARRHPRLLGNFDACCLSYQVGCFKPEPEIYSAAERLFGRSGGDLVFIDDREENAAAAERRGWRAIHHTGLASTLAQLRDLGLPVLEEYL